MRLDYSTKPDGHSVINANPEEEAKMAQKMQPIFDEYVKNAKNWACPVRGVELVPGVPEDCSGK